MIRVGTHNRGLNQIKFSSKNSQDSHDTFGLYQHSSTVVQEIQVMS
ncbi:hypothetical protein AOT82_1186 [Psychrobacter sp. AntiMn-1]|nr:hypothetical protein AOT82_1186 [Psychrobacter sp. AntiMn-1]